MANNFERIVYSSSISTSKNTLKICKQIFDITPPIKFIRKREKRRLVSKEIISETSLSQIRKVISKRKKHIEYWYFGFQSDEHDVTVELYERADFEKHYNQQIEVLNISNENVFFSSNNLLTSTGENL